LLDEPDRAGYLLLKALAQLANRNPELARATLKSFRSQVSLDKSGEADWHYLMALVDRQSGAVTGALEQWRAALDLDPRHPHAKLDLARLAALNRDFARVSELLTELLADTPDLADARELAGAVALVEGDSAGAVQELKIALAHAPNATRVLKLGTAEARAGQHAAAFGTLRAWLADQPRDTNVRLALANQLLTAGQDDEAASEFQKVLVVDPLNVVALNNAAWLAHRSGDSGRALDQAERAYGLMPENAGVLDTLGVVLMEAGQLERARDLLARATRRAPSDLQIQAHYGRALALLGQKDDAQDLLGQILSTNPELAQAESVRLLQDELRD
jgi:tetratricopeptide (TPR) repeat protein